MSFLPQAAGVPMRSTAWSDRVTLQQVDPALGIQSLTLSLTGTVASTAAVINLDAVPSVFESWTTGTVVLSRPDGSVWLSAAPVAFIHATLPNASIAGGVPWRFSGQGSAVSSVGYLPAQTGSADAALLVGTGQVTLPVTASARIHATGPANMTALFTSIAGADVSLTAATSTSPGGGSSDFSLFGGLQLVNFPGYFFWAGQYQVSNAQRCRCVHRHRFIFDFRRL